MTENESSNQSSLFGTLNFDALLTRKQLANETTRDGCFVIDDPVDIVEELDYASVTQGPDALPAQTSSELENETVQTLSRKPLPSITRLSTKSTAQDSFVLLQKWEGVVTRITDDSFISTLRDLTSESADEEAEIPIEEVPRADITLLAPGAVFYWCIGYLDRLGGQRIRASEIRFRRLPPWSDRELESARREADEISDLLDWK
jgi:hypothetical protein